ncbi:glycosyltransferase family 2 protein [Neomoorella thermoacetica]|uniref:glycosyltransferase family 2 protein n=1 Tax=Neomoorella thermoacetica TaxID=1525 RepID=UPI0008FAFC96|nr:glycosyltransferase family 2 protein [Moorella thermoacetica]OIQ52784.1 undecaprenyl-phosphate mannosyltransferase [Moorella thermoacetica]
MNEKRNANENINYELDLKDKKVTVLLCTLNEEKNLPYILPSIPKFVNEILIVDGHSKDNTVKVAKQLLPKARIIFQPGKGKGDALRHGIKEASGDIIVMLDADGSMSPEEIPRFIKPLLDGYDFVKGSRFLPGGGTADMPAHRIFGNWVFTTLTNIFHRCRYTDLCYGYNAFWKKSFEKISFQGNGFEVETEINIKIKKAGLKVIEVPSYEAPRLNGKGNLHSLKDGWRILKTIFRELISI